MKNSSLKAAEIEALGTCAGFAMGVLRMQPYPWADRIFSDLDRRGAAVALRASNGSGKTTGIGAPAALWHASVFANSLCIVTAGVFRQVKEQFFSTIQAHAHKFPGWTFNECEVTGHNGSRILGFSTDDPGRFEGWHNDNLLVIVDEAKSVPDMIFEAVERCQPTRLLLLSSPGGCSGAFYEAFHARRKFFSQHVVKASDCPHISPKWVAEQIEKYGEGHPLIASMIFAEFMSAGEDGTVIPLIFVERCLANPPEFRDGTVQAFCDFAAGGDENVFAVRRGNRVQIVAHWREKDTMRAVGRFIQLFQEQKLTPQQIHADEGGMGIVMCDALREAGWPVRRVNNGSPSRSEHYFNKGAEMWYGGRRLIERREIILPNDKELVSQMSTRLGWPDSKGRMQLESKQDMRSRGLSSPDKADAVLGAMAQLLSGPRVMLI
jgi:phage terminase large subunit